LAQLDGVVGELAATRAGAGAVLAGLLLQLALRVEGAGGRLQREVGAFAAGELAGGTDITSHFLSPPLDATLLRRTAPVVRDRRHVDDVGDLVAHVVERTDGRLAAEARALDADFKRLHAVVEGGLAGLLRGDLGSERGRLARAAETRAARSRPRERVALAVGDGNDGVVERSMHVRDAVGDDALDLLLGLCCRLGHGLGSLFPDGLARTLTGTGIGPGALAAQREAAAMAQAAVAGQVHQALDRHADLAAAVALDHVLADLGAQALDFGLGQVTDLGVRGHAGGFADLLRTGTADAVDALQPDPDVLLGRQVDTCNTRHARISNSLGQPEGCSGAVNKKLYQGPGFQGSPRPPMASDRPGMGSVPMLRRRLPAGRGPLRGPARPALLWRRDWPWSHLRAGPPRRSPIKARPRHGRAMDPGK